MIQRLVLLLTCLIALGVAQAAQLGVGSTREAVIAALGEPVGRSSAGSREVLSYPGGRVFLREGRVEELDPALVSVEPANPPPADTVIQPAPKKPAPAPAPAPVETEAPAPAEHNWIKPALMTLFLCVVLLLGRHWMRVAMRAQAEKKRDLLSR